MERKNLFIFLAVVSLLLVVSLACKQAGSIITPAEATQRYEATQEVLAGDVSGDAFGAQYLTGEEAVLTGDGYLVPLYQLVGDQFPVSNATRGDVVTILGSVNYEEEIWYKVESLGGDHWVPGSSLEPVE